jgi:hypothetical protein
MVVLACCSCSKSKERVAREKTASLYEAGRLHTLFLLFFYRLPNGSSSDLLMERIVNTLLSQE